MYSASTSVCALPCILSAYAHYLVIMFPVVDFSFDRTTAQRFMDERITSNIVDLMLTWNLEYGMDPRVHSARKWSQDFQVFLQYTNTSNICLGHRALRMV